MSLRSTFARCALGCALALTAITVTGCDGNGGSSGFSGAMTGEQVVPAVTTIHTGTFNLVYKAEGQYVRITLTHDIPDLTAATINGPAVAGQNAPVVFDVLANQIPNARRGAEFNSPIIADWEIDEINDQRLKNGELYALLSSMTFPGGELRGQINGPAKAAPPEGAYTLRGFHTTFLEGTLLPDGMSGFTPKFAGNLFVDNTFDVPVRLRIGLLGNSVNWPFETPLHADASTDPDTNELVFTSNFDTPPNFSEYAGIFYDALVSSDQEFSATYEAFDANSAPDSTPIDTGQLSFSVAWRPGSIYDALTTTIGEIDTGNEIPFNTQLAWTYGLGLTPRPLSFTGSTPTLGSGAQQIVGFYSGIVTNIGYAPLTDGMRGTVKPCGPIDGGGLFVCPTDQGTTNTGTWLLVAMLLDDVVPLNDATNSYQYGFVFDGDLNTDNNFVNTNPDFENDFFQGTDTWYTLNYDPMSGWSLFAIDASGGGTPQRYFTDSGAIIRDNMIMMLIPTDEFATGSPRLRVTAFRHPGDFGAGGDFGLDYDPGLGEPLLPLATTW